MRSRAIADEDAAMDSRAHPYEGLSPLSIQRPPARSRIRDAAEQHRNARWLVKMDVMNFFESILEPKVYEVFRSFGYQPLMAFELTRLCHGFGRAGIKTSQGE